MMISFLGHGTLSSLVNFGWVLFRMEDFCWFGSSIKRAGLTLKVLEKKGPSLTHLLCQAATQLGALAGFSAAWISEELLMEVYPGLVEYYANQVHLQALLLLVVVDCGCLGKKHPCWETPFFCAWWWWQVFFPVFWEGQFLRNPSTYDW